MSDTQPFYVLVDVTADDIRRGEAGAPSRCPVALALARAEGGGTNILVTAGPVMFDRDGKIWSAQMPQAGSCFVRQFDRRVKVLGVTIGGRLGNWLRRRRSAVRPFEMALTFTEEK